MKFASAVLLAAATRAAPIECEDTLAQTPSPIKDCAVFTASQPCGSTFQPFPTAPAVVINEVCAKTCGACIGSHAPTGPSTGRPTGPPSSAPALPPCSLGLPGPCDDGSDATAAPALPPCSLGLPGPCDDSRDAAAAPACITPQPISTKAIDVTEFVRASWFVQFQMETPQTTFPEDFTCGSATYDSLLAGVTAPEGVSITASNAQPKGSVVLCVGTSNVGGKLKVAPCPVFELVPTPNFNVLDFGANEKGEYEWAVILGGQEPEILADDGLCLPNFESGLFLYTREEVASDEINAAMLAAVEAAGVSTSKLFPVDQSDCGDYNGRRLKPSMLAGPEVPTTFVNFCPNGFPKGDPRADCEEEDVAVAPEAPSSSGLCEDTLASTPSPIKDCVEYIKSNACGTSFSPFSGVNIVTNDVCAKTCNACPEPETEEPEIEVLEIEEPKENDRGLIQWLISILNQLIKH